MQSPIFASATCIAAVKLFEGYRAEWYLCPTGKPTIGYGHVRLPGDSYTSLSPAEAEAIMLGDLAKMAKALWPLLGPQPTQAQFDGMLSLAFNVGVGIHDGKKNDLADSDLLLFYNAGYIGMAADEFLSWDKYHDPKDGQLKVLPSLHERRVKERAIFLGQA